jgi:hypothetical protein
MREFDGQTSLASIFFAKTSGGGFSAPHLEGAKTAAAMREKP